MTRCASIFGKTAQQSYKMSREADEHPLLSAVKCGANGTVVT